MLLSLLLLGVLTVGAPAQFIVTAKDTFVSGESLLAGYAGAGIYDSNEVVNGTLPSQVFAVYNLAEGDCPFEHTCTYPSASRGLHSSYIPGLDPGLYGVRLYQHDCISIRSGPGVLSPGFIFLRVQAPFAFKHIGVIVDHYTYNDQQGSVELRAGFTADVDLSAVASPSYPTYRYASPNAPEPTPRWLIHDLAMSAVNVSVPANTPYYISFMFSGPDTSDESLFDQHALCNIQVVVTDDEDSNLLPISRRNETGQPKPTAPVPVCVELDADTHRWRTEETDKFVSHISHLLDVPADDVTVVAVVPQNHVLICFSVAGRPWTDVMRVLRGATREEIGWVVNDIFRQGTRGTTLLLGLSSGSLVAIVFGVIGIVAIITGVAVYFKERKEKYTHFTDAPEEFPMPEVYVEGESTKTDAWSSAT